MNSVANLALAAESHVGNIAFIDLRAQQRRIRPAIESRLQKVLDHGRYIAGPEIEELEELLAARTGAKAAVTCCSGTSALVIALLARGVGPGDAVFVPAFTYNATANAVLLTGATPVFIDIDRSTFNMDPAHLSVNIESVRASGKLAPKAVIPVDLFGSPADYSSILKIAAKDDLFVLADGAQSFGGKLGNKWVGDLAPATATSFFPGKALGAYGDAGAIFAQDEAEAELWESIRWHGTDENRKDSIRVGLNGRMDSFQAAVLLEKIAIFDDEQKARHRIAAIYNKRFEAIGRPQQHLENAVTSNGYYSLCVEDRDKMVAALNAVKVPTAVYYATPLHQMAAFSKYAPEGGLPNTEAVANEIFSVPMHPYLTPEQVDYICDAVVSAAE